MARLVLSAFYQVAPEHKLRVIAPDVWAVLAKIYIYLKSCVSLGIYEDERIVKWTSTARGFLTDAHGRDHVVPKMAFDANNNIPVCRWTPLRMGRICRFFLLRYQLILCHLVGQYAMLNVHVMCARFTPILPVDAYRGAGGRKQAIFWALIETAARELGVSPAELRRQNFVMSSRTRHR